MGKPLALVVEDEYDIAIIFANALQAAGYETEVIRSGDTTLTWLSSMVPDVVVLDLHLPRVPGEDILRRIRADPRLANTKVIVATAYAHLAERLQDKADWVLIKPVSFGRLRDLVTTHLSPAASSDEEQANEKNDATSSAN